MMSRVRRPESRASHYGTFARPFAPLTGVTIMDEADGSQSNAMIERKKEPGGQQGDDDQQNLLTHSVTSPVKLEASKWYTYTVGRG